MTAIFDEFEVASFAGFKFPYRTYSAKGAIRDHVHEYPHSPGGAPEKLGRKLYEITFDAVFPEARILSAAQRARYGTDLFTTQLNNLRQTFESQTTDKLVIPHVGSMQAYAISWDEKADAKDRSAVSAQIVFREDQTAAFAFELARLSPTTLPQKIDNFEKVRQQLAQQQQDVLNPKHNLWEKFRIQTGAVLAVLGKAEMYGALYASKLAGLSNLLYRFDSEAKELDNPDNFLLLEALHDLWDTTNKTLMDVQQKQQPMRFYTTPLLMSVGDVSAAVYGTTEFGLDLMRLNTLEDPLAIPAGVRLAYYPRAA